MMTTMNFIQYHFASESHQFFSGMAVRWRFMFLSEYDGMTTAAVSLINHSGAPDVPEPVELPYFLESRSRSGAFHSAGRRLVML